VNEHGLLYTWQGSDVSLKPLLLMAHSDVRLRRVPILSGRDELWLKHKQVVPVNETMTETWTHPPFSGHYDGEYIWGRGSEDDKSNLIAMLTVIELLLSQGFRPARTVILSIGFDEEGGAEQSYGARCLAQELLSRYGKDGVEMIVS